MLSNPPYGKSWSSEVKNIKNGKEIIDSRFEVEQKDLWGVVSKVDATPRTSDGQLLFLMEMISKMNSYGSRIASVHNGSSLFTGDAGGGESNIRRHIIENDWLECIIQLPNNLFYNTGITTYIWILSNKKTKGRQRKVQLIDASNLYQKLRKNLGNKNCELSPENITTILQTYLSEKGVERKEENSIAAKIFDNSDFGYYKVTVERPKRLKAQFTEERIASLRFDKTLQAPMKWAYNTFGDEVYTNLVGHEKEILDWADHNELDLNTKQSKALVNPDLWKKQLDLYNIAEKLMEIIGRDEYNNFNQFAEKIDKILKTEKIKLSASEKNSIFSAVSWYDAEAEKVVKSKMKLTDIKLLELTEHLFCSVEQLPHYGYYPTGNKNEFIIYESESDLRDYENVPLKDNIYDYFLLEVNPYVSEAWINLDATKIGYEISFNKYFYQHKPLRTMEEVAVDILKLDAESDGLIREILDLA